MKTKIRCKNCGTTLKDTDISCPICHMKPERTEIEKKEVEEKIIHHSEKSPIWRYGLVVLIIIGLILFTIGFLHMRQVTYCDNDRCTARNLFMMALGLTMTISSTITLIRYLKK